MYKLFNYIGGIILYVQSHSIKYSELDCDGFMTLGAIMTCFQDIAIDHSEYVGCTLKWLREQNEAFLLYSWKVNVYQYPEFPQTLNIITNADEYRSIYCRRIFKMYNQSNILIADAESIWINTDTEKMRPIRITPAVMNLFSENAKVLDNIDTPKIEIPKTADISEKVGIYKRDLDTNNHLNNIRSVQIMSENLGDRPNKAEVVYKKAIKPNSSVICNMTKTAPNEKITALFNDENVLCVIGRFSFNTISHLKSL